MKYGTFLKKCRELTRIRKGKNELSREDFALLCSNSERSYAADTLRNIEEGYKAPGRELLEAAARAAGFEFEDCIRLPDVPLSERDAALVTFDDALNDRREAAALRFALALAKMPRGRPGKKQ